MRSAKRSHAVADSILVQQSGDGMNRDYFERLVLAQRGENRRDAAREHRLARAGRADQQDIVTSGGGYFERALCSLLTDDFRKIGNRLRGTLDVSFVPCCRKTTVLEPARQLAKRARRAQP